MTILPSSPGDPNFRGLYVHIPFCLVRCAYCDFNAYSGMDHLAPSYVEAVIREIKEETDGEEVSSIFFGGGTPTQLQPAQLAKIINEIHAGFSVAPDAEITIEANPETVDRKIFRDLLSVGFNRVSVGVQSTSESVLRKLGRVHSSDRAVAALVDALGAAFERVNADLIFGTPGETFQEWLASLERVVSTGVDHVSCYALTIEPGTPLQKWVERGAAEAPNDDDQADKYEAASEFLEASGFVRYETSNWSRPGSHSRHNLGYWQGSNYLGFGAGAHAHRAGVRSWNVRSPQAYISASPQAEDGFEVLSHKERAEEMLLLALRLAGGLDICAFERIWEMDPLLHWRDPLRHLVESGLITIGEGRIRPASQGFLLGSYVARALLSPSENAPELPVNA